MRIEIPAFHSMLKANAHLDHDAFSIDLGEDVVKVVRCKNCKHFDGEYCHFWGNIAPCKNDFCNYGEKDGENNV